MGNFRFDGLEKRKWLTKGVHVQKCFGRVAGWLKIFGTLLFLPPPLHKLQNFFFLIFSKLQNFFDPQHLKNCFNTPTPITMLMISILGPLLFILHVNDITYTSNILDFILFADDTTILYSHKDINREVDMVKEELQEVNNWLRLINRQ